MKKASFLFSLLLIGITGISLFIYSGLFSIGADTPHSKPVYWLLEQTRERAIERASKDIAIPLLKDPSLLLSGGADYNDMCSSCHLKPGQKESDLSMGLYPAPPNLALKHDDKHEHGNQDALTRKRFWVIKHGIKASGMPAWGLTHDDERIWAMVAFLEKLPELTPEQYQILTARD